jgi:hypothetical protein
MHPTLRVIKFALTLGDLLQGVSIQRGAVNLVVIASIPFVLSARIRNLINLNKFRGREGLYIELKPHNIKVHTINPGAYLTGFNQTMAEAAFHWLDDSKNFTKRGDLHKTYDELLRKDEGRLNPQEMIDAMVSIVPADTGKFRSVVPKAVEDFLKVHQLDAWEKQI